MTRRAGRTPAVCLNASVAPKAAVVTAPSAFPGRAGRMTEEAAAATCAPYPSGTIRVTPRGAEVPTWMRTARSSARPPT